MHTQETECVLLNSTTHLASKVTWAPHSTTPGFPLKLATLVSGNRRCFLSDDDVPTYMHTKLLYTTTFLFAFQIVVYVSVFLLARPTLYNCSSTRWFRDFLNGFVHSWFGSVVVITVSSKLQEIRDLVVLEHGTRVFCGWNLG